MGSPEVTGNRSAPAGRRDRDVGSFDRRRARSFDLGPLRLVGAVVAAPGAGYRPGGNG